MAGLKRCLGIDLGSSRIKVAEVQVDKAGLRLVRVLQADVDIPPGTDEDERALRLTRALRDLLKANKVTTRDAIFCVPGQAVFQRPVKLPKTSPDRLRRIIEYEARQQIPFPLEQTIFEYQVFEDPQNPEEVEVLLAAIKRDTIQSHVRLFRKTGLKIAGISVSYFALFNYHLFDQGRVELESKKIEKAKAEAAAAKKKDKPDKKTDKKGGFNFSFGKKKATAAVGAPEEEETPAVDEEAIPEFEMDEEDAGPSELLLEEIKAYVNLGATSMDLSIPKGGGLGLVGFCRTIPHAGNEMTKAVQAALALDSFREAEEVKKTQAAVLAMTFDGDGDSAYNRKACEAVTQVVDRRVIGELRRSLDFYISQPDGVAVDGLVLSGGQANLPFLATYIEEKLGVPVEVVDEFHNSEVKLGEGVDSAEWSSAALAVGLAVQGVGVSPISIDFLPRELRTVREFTGRYRELGIMVALLGGMVYLSSGIGKTETQKYIEARETIEANVSREYKQASDAFNAAQAERQAVVDKIKNLERITEPRDLWLEFLAEVLREKPTDIVLNYLQMKSDGAITITGECGTQIPIIDFAENLKNRTDLVRDVKIDYLNPTPTADPLGRFPQGTFPFQLTMRHAMKHIPIKATPTPTPIPTGTATPAA